MAKKRHRISKTAKQNILIILVVVLILTFLVVEIANVIGVGLETEVAYATTVYDSIETRAVFIRDEQAIKGVNGISVPTVSDGEKVGTGGEIAMTFSSEENAQRYSNFLTLEEKHEYYTELENTTVGSVTDIEALESNILNDINSFIRSASRNDVSSANDNALKINDNFTRRTLLVGDTVNFSSVLSEIEAGITALDVSSCKPTGYITADTAGYYSKYTDGCEGLFNYSEIKNITVDSFNDYFRSALDASCTTQGGGKIVKSFVWYLACVVSADEIEGLEDGYNTKVVIKSTDTELKCTVIKGADISLDDDYTLLLLSCNEMDKDLLTMRVEDIEIRKKSYTGIKVSESALHEKDGEKGVYALVSNIAKWRKAKVLYKGDDYYILSYNDSDITNGIKLYDKIIIRGRDVYDGKVFA